MKKNLLSILILALLIVNIVLTTILLISVAGPSKKTANLVDTIATVMNLELTGAGGEEQETKPEVSLADTYVYNITGNLTIPLAKDANGKQGYMIFNIAFSCNTKHPDYKTYSETLSTYEPLIKDAVGNVISPHTEEECRANMDKMKEEILDAVNKLFDSDFIYNVALSEVKFG